MACGLIGQLLNLALLIVLVGCAVFYMLPLWQSGDIWSSNAARAHAAGVGSSGVAAVLFLLTWCTGSKVLGALTCVAAAVDVACYLTWRTLGDESLELFCSGAESAAAALPDTAVATASNYLSCDFFAYTWIFWALIAVSGAFQILVAIRSFGCCGETAAAGAAFAALELGKDGRGERRRAGRRRRTTRGRVQRDPEDTEAHMPLQEEREWDEASEEEKGAMREDSRRLGREGGRGGSRGGLESGRRVEQLRTGSDEEQTGFS